MSGFTVAARIIITALAGWIIFVLTCAHTKYQGVNNELGCNPFSLFQHIPAVSIDFYLSYCCVRLFTYHRSQFHGNVTGEKSHPETRKAKPHLLLKIFRQRTEGRICLGNGVSGHLGPNVKISKYK